MSLLLGQDRWACRLYAWHPTASLSLRATRLPAIGANGSFCRRSFAPLSPGATGVRGVAGRPTSAGRGPTTLPKTKAGGEISQYSSCKGEGWRLHQCWRYHVSTLTRRNIIQVKWGRGGGELVNRCFDPRQLLGIISGLKETFIKRYIV